MPLILRWLISALAILITSYLLPGVALSGVVTALIVAAVLGVINVFLRPMLLILTLPVNILTLGLFTFVINGLLILLTSALVPGFSVASFWWAMLFSLVLSLASMVLHSFVRE